MFGVYVPNLNAFTYVFLQKKGFDTVNWQFPLMSRVTRAWLFWPWANPRSLSLQGNRYSLVFTLFSGLFSCVAVIWIAYARTGCLFGLAGGILESSFLFFSLLNLLSIRFISLSHSRRSSQYLSHISLFCLPVALLYLLPYCTTAPRDPRARERLVALVFRFP